MSDTSDRMHFGQIAKLTRESIRSRKAGTGISLYRPAHVRPRKTNSDGWLVELGWLRSTRCGIEVWFDRYPRNRARNVWFGFYSAKERPIGELVRRSKTTLGVTQTLTLADVDSAAPVNKQRLRKPLAISHLEQPILESYETDFYYGIYLPNMSLASNANRQHIAEKIAEFTESVARSYPIAKPHDPDSEIYSSIENRKTVVTHLRRERNTYLAQVRKERDRYQCRVCGMKFDDEYGALGNGFAESHHIVPLSKLHSVQLTEIDDLITVCANCHRMLHRLPGKADDWQRLKGVVARHRRHRRKPKR